MSLDTVNTKSNLAKIELKINSYLYKFNQNMKTKWNQDNGSGKVPKSKLLKKSLFTRKGLDF